MRGLCPSYFRLGLSQKETARYNTNGNIRHQSLDQNVILITSGINLRLLPKLRWGSRWRRNFACVLNCPIFPAATHPLNIFSGCICSHCIRKVRSYQGRLSPQRPRRYSPNSPFFPPFPIPPFPSLPHSPFPLASPLPAPLVLPSPPSIHSPPAAKRPPWSQLWDLGERCKLSQWSPTSILVYSGREKLIWQQLLYGFLYFLYTKIC